MTNETTEKYISSFATFPNDDLSIDEREHREGNFHRFKQELNWLTFSKNRTANATITTSQDGVEYDFTNTELTEKEFRKWLENAQAYYRHYRDKGKPARLV